MTPSTALRRSRALFLAISQEKEGPQLSARVMKTMEALLLPAADGQRKDWTYMEADGLRWAIGKLGGPASAARHLGVSPSTIRGWSLRERVPSEMLARMTELIEARAVHRRRPNRWVDRHQA